MSNLGDVLRNLGAVSRAARRAKRDVDSIGGGRSVSPGAGASAPVNFGPVSAQLSRIERQTRRGDTFQQRARKVGL